MNDPTIVTGDDVALSVTLKKGGATFLINGTATVQASLVSLDHQTTYAGPVAQSNAASGADWANSLVVVELASANTSSITYQGKALLEIQVDDSGKTTFFASVIIVLGTI